MSREPRVLHLIDSLGLGGAQTVVKGIFEVQKTNQNIFLFSLRERSVNFDVDHLNVIRFPSVKKFSLQPLNALRQLIQQENIEILHCHLFRSQVFGFLLKKLWFKKLKLVFHEHGEVFTQTPHYKFFLQATQKSVDGYVAVSQATAGLLHGFGAIPERKIFTIYNFIQQDLFDQAPTRNELLAVSDFSSLRSTDFIVGFVGRLSEVKGCEYLIRSAMFLSKNVKIVIAGEGPLRNQLTQLVSSLGVADQILFLGYVKNKQQLYPVFDVLALPSLSEACPMVVLESDLARVPVIGSRAPAIDEFVHDGVWHGPPFSNNNLVK